MIGAGASAAAGFGVGRSSGLDVLDCIEPWKEIRAGGSGGYLVVSVEGKKVVIEEGSNEGGFDTVQACCKKSNSRVLYGSFPFRNKGLLRFAFFSFIGNEVGGMARGRVSLQRAGVYAAFDGVTADLSFNGIEEVTRDFVVQALSRLPGVEGLELM